MGKGVRWMKISSLLERFTQLDFDHFLERSVQEIKNFPLDKPMTYDDAGELIVFYYEMEYKWYYLSHNPFTGSPRRRDNILAIFEDQFKKIILVMAQAFSGVFEGWLEVHALTSPKEWAESRYAEREDQDTDEIFEGVIDEFYRYYRMNRGLKAPPGYFMNSKDLKKAQLFLTQQVNKLPVIQEWITLMNQDMEGEEDYSPIDDVFEFYENPNDLFKALENYSYELAERLVIETNQQLVFPEWFQYWKARGIVETRKRIEEIYNQLQVIGKMPLMEQSALINLAIQATHQGGSMLEYFNDKYGVDQEVFDQFEENVPDEWEAELEELGVDMSNEKNSRGYGEIRRAPY